MMKWLIIGALALSVTAVYLNWDNVRQLDSVNALLRVFGIETDSTENTEEGQTETGSSLNPQPIGKDQRGTRSATTTTTAASSAQKQASVKPFRYYEAMVVVGHDTMPDRRIVQHKKKGIIVAPDPTPKPGSAMYKQCMEVTIQEINIKHGTIIPIRISHRDGTAEVYR